eukprot:TRINITY_DN26096_c0_g1_i1.p1 TRINITY_DN26096_c0_g1~~TRINITY_DN26096_c0_g1_i1.p1  ORF type:complete len:1079 (-),score=234.02 TRINITY_DN26096_c0_g1_i1:144-3380(-)
MATPPKQWMVTVTLTDKMRLGVDADWSDGKTLYIKNVLAGAVEHWNKQNPSLAVGTGDRILSVNHAKGDAQAMVREIKEKHVLQMLCEKAAAKESQPVGVPGMVRAGEQIPGMPPRTVDVLLELRAKAAEKESGSTPARALPPEDGEPPNHYQVLGIDNKADDAAIKKSYRKLVLTWHPDKHPSERDEAEVQIRLINLAYECISNPLKRQSYDQMLAALERKKLGIRLETQFIKPRMSIPKEFMLCPLGYSDKFVRVVDNVLLVQTREQAPGIAFQEFFQAAKFSLWWLPEVNNMCRLRPRETAGQGMDGGNNLCFDFRPGDEEEPTAEASCKLREDQDSKKCNLIVSASPFSQGAFRFEAAFWPGRHLSYRRPGKILMAGKADSGSDSADFLLVDYSTAYKFMTTSEVLKGACESQGGSQGDYVKLSDIRADLSVRLYFQQMLGSAVWNNKDFETFFEGHYDEWDFDVKKSRVRMRPDGPLMASASAPAAPAPAAPVPMEVEAASGLTDRLRCANSQSSTVKVLLAANGDDLARLPPNAAIPVLNRLAEKSSQLPPEKLASLKAAKRRFLITLPVLLGEGVFSIKKDRRRDSDVELTLKELLGMEKSVANIEREDTEKELGTACKGARESIVELMGARIRDAPKEVTIDGLSELLALPLNWGTVAASLAEALTPLLQKQKPGALLQPLRTAARLGKGAAPVVECLGRTELRGIAYSDGATAAEILTALAESGLETAAVASKLRPPLLPRLPLPELVSIVAALAEHGLSDDLLRPPLQARVAVAGPGLATVPPSRLLRLAAVAPRAACVAECALGAIAGAAAANLEIWPAEDVAELMLIVATTTSGPTISPGAKRLFLRVGEVLIPQLRKASRTVLLKVVVAAGAAASSCRELLEAAAGHIVTKLPDMKPDQVMLFTQGVLPLGGSHQVVVRLLSYWAQMLAGPIDSRDLTPDDIAQLAMLLAMVAPDHGLVFQVIGIRLQEAASRLTEAGHSALDAAFPGGAGGPNFPGKENLISALAEAKKKKQEEAEKKKQEALERQRKKEEEEERRKQEKSEKKSAKAARTERSRSRSRSRRRS